MGAEEVKQFLNYLAVDKHVSALTREI